MGGVLRMDPLWLGVTWVVCSGWSHSGWDPHGWCAQDGATLAGIHMGGVLRMDHSGWESHGWFAQNGSIRLGVTWVVCSGKIHPGWMQFDTELGSGQDRSDYVGEFCDDTAGNAMTIESVFASFEIWEPIAFDTASGVMAHLGRCFSAPSAYLIPPVMRRRMDIPCSVVDSTWNQNKIASRFCQPFELGIASPRQNAKKRAFADRIWKI